jgi:hypothetical protein
VRRGAGGDAALGDRFSGDGEQRAHLKRRRRSRAAQAGMCVYLPVPLIKAHSRLGPFPLRPMPNQAHSLSGPVRRRSPARAARRVFAALSDLLLCFFACLFVWFLLLASDSRACLFMCLFAAQVLALEEALRTKDLAVERANRAHQVSTRLQRVKCRLASRRRERPPHDGATGSSALEHCWQEVSQLRLGYSRGYSHGYSCCEEVSQLRLGYSQGYSHEYSCWQEVSQLRLGYSRGYSHGYSCCQEVSQLRLEVVELRNHSRIAKASLHTVPSRNGTRRRGRECTRRRWSQQHTTWRMRRGPDRSGGRSVAFRFG